MGNFLSTLTGPEMPVWLALVVITFVFLYSQKDIKSIKENLSKLETRMDENFKHLNSRLDKVFDNPQKANVS